MNILIQKWLCKSFILPPLIPFEIDIFIGNLDNECIMGIMVPHITTYIPAITI